MARNDTVAGRMIAAAVCALAIGCTSGFAADPPATQPAAAPVAPQVQGDASAAPKAAGSGLTAKQAVKNFDRMMQGETDEDLGDDPLGTVADRMTDVHADLTQMKTNKPVQQKEQQVVADLDLIIKKLTPKGGGNGGNTPGQGRKRSVIVNGDPAFGDLHGVDPRRSEWAKLPPKERDQILQSQTEGFPPGYESLLQSYYQRLAQEKPADEKGADAPATAPAAP